MDNQGFVNTLLANACPFEQTNTTMKFHVELHCALYWITAERSANGNWTVIKMEVDTD